MWKDKLNLVAGKSCFKFELYISLFWLAKVEIKSVECNKYPIIKFYERVIKIKSKYWLFRFVICFGENKIKFRNSDFILCMCNILFFLSLGLIHFLFLFDEK